MYDKIEDYIRLLIKLKVFLQKNHKYNDKLTNNIRIELKKEDYHKYNDQHKILQNIIEK